MSSHTWEVEFDSQQSYAVIFWGKDVIGDDYVSDRCRNYVNTCVEGVYVGPKGFYALVFRSLKHCFALMAKVANIFL